MTRLFVPANDDKPTEAWLEFYADKELYSYACRELPDLAVGLKNKRSHMDEETAERSCANFIWFIKFEKSFYENRIQETQNKIQLVKESI